MSAGQRTRMYADPAGVFLHDAILAACHRYAYRTAIVDTSCVGPSRRITYAEFGDLMQTAAKNLVAAGLEPGDIIAIYLSNSWEYAVAFHAAVLAGGVPTLLNPSYREREVRYQLEDSGASVLVTDGVFIGEMNLNGLANLKQVYTTRHPSSGAKHFTELLRPSQGH